MRLPCQFTTIDQLNLALDKWLEETAKQRAWPDDRSQLVRAVYAEEQQKLIALPEEPFSVRMERPARSGKIPFIRFDKNDYSIPFEYAGQQPSLSATLKEVFISHLGEVIAQHERSYSGGERIINQKHFERLIAERPGRESIAGRSYPTKPSST